MSTVLMCGLVLVAWTGLLGAAAFMLIGSAVCIWLVLCFLEWFYRAIVLPTMTFLGELGKRQRKV